MGWRYRFSLFAFIFFFLVLVVRLFYWQVVRASELQAIGQAQYGKQVSLQALRGEIKTSDDFSIVANKLSYLVFANPKEIGDKKEIVEKLAPILETDPASISAQLALNRFWVPLKSPIDN